MIGMSVFDLFEDMEVIRIRSGILPGEEIPNGYAGQYCTAPEAPGRYTLLHLVDPDDRTHRGFIFEKEKELNETDNCNCCD